MKAKALMLTSLMIFGLLAGCIGADEDTERIEEETKTIEGCTDSSAANYNPDANADDGSCMVLMPVDAIASVFEAWGSPMIDPVWETTDSRIGFEIMHQQWDNRLDAGLHMASLTILNDVIPDGYEMTMTRENPDGQESMLCTCPDQDGIGATEVSIVVPIGDDCSSPSADLQLTEACGSIDNPGVGTIFIGSYSVIDAAIDSPPTVHAESSYKVGNNEVYKTENVGGMVLGDGTYVKDGEDTRTLDVRDTTTFIRDQRTTAPLQGTDLNKVLTDEQCDGGGIATRGSDASCMWSIPVFESIFGSYSPEATADGQSEWAWIETQLDDFKIDYTEGAEGISYEFTLTSPRVATTGGLSQLFEAKIMMTLSSDGTDLLSFAASSNKTNENQSTYEVEVIKMTYLYEDSEGEIQHRAATFSGQGVNEIDEDPFFWYLCNCNCHPDGQYWLRMSIRVHHLDVWEICLNHCVSNYCDLSTPGGPYPPERSYSKSAYAGGVSPGDFSVDASWKISETPLAPPTIALEFACNPNEGWDGVRTVALEKIGNGESDCGASNNDEKLSELKPNGIVFVVTESQAKNPDIGDFKIRFMSIEGDAIVEKESKSLANTVEARAQEGEGEENEQNEAERTVTYIDVDEDGKVSAGDRIEITMDVNDFITFSVGDSQQMVPIHGEKDTSGYLLVNTRQISCEERSPEGSLCDAYRTVTDPITGFTWSMHYCELRAEGYDCDGNPIGVTE